MVLKTTGILGKSEVIAVSSVNDIHARPMCLRDTRRNRHVEPRMVRILVVNVLIYHSVCGGFRNSYVNVVRQLSVAASSGLTTDNRTGIRLPS